MSESSNGITAADFDAMMDVGRKRTHSHGTYRSPLRGSVVTSSDKTYEEYKDSAFRTRNLMLDAMGAAFLKETGLRPDETELVQEATPKGIRFYFRERE